MVDSQKYVVIDVETNGLSSKKDDLLSISLYRPDNQDTYTRFLPLERNLRIKTSRINGITQKDLMGKKALTQAEVDSLTTRFELKTRIVLQYSNLDGTFLRKYFSRHGLTGIEDWKIYNFKQDIFSSAYQGGNCTKDNLCRLYKIENVTKVHSGANDCRLEWELFQAMNGKNLLVTGNDVFEFNEEYIVPVTFRSLFPNFKRKYPLPPIQIVNRETVFRYPLETPIEKYGRNITGVIVEQVIFYLLRAKDVTPLDFMVENKAKLKKIGTLPSADGFEEVPVEFEKMSGEIRALNPSQKKIVESMEAGRKLLVRQIDRLIHFIKNDIFKGKQIVQQELVVKKEWNCFALCDLSSTDAVLEIKTVAIKKLDDYVGQYFIESAGREFYLLSISWEKEISFLIEKLEFGCVESY